MSGSRERGPAFRFDCFALSISLLARALDEFRALEIEFVSLHEVGFDADVPCDVPHCRRFAELDREIIRGRQGRSPERSQARLRGSGGGGMARGAKEDQGVGLGFTHRFLLL